MALLGNLFNQRKKKTKTKIEISKFIFFTKVISMNISFPKNSLKQKKKLTRSRKTSSKLEKKHLCHNFCLLRDLRIIFSL